MKTLNSRDTKIISRYYHIIPQDGTVLVIDWELSLIGKTSNYINTETRSLIDKKIKIRVHRELWPYLDQIIDCTDENIRR